MGTSKCASAGRNIRHSDLHWPHFVWAPDALNLAWVVGPSCKTLRASAVRACDDPTTREGPASVEPWCNERIAPARRLNGVLDRGHRASCGRAVVESPHLHWVRSTTPRRHWKGQRPLKWTCDEPECPHAGSTARGVASADPTAGKRERLFQGTDDVKYVGAKVLQGAV